MATNKCNKSTESGPGRGGAGGAPGRDKKSAIECRRRDVVVGVEGAEEQQKCRKISRRMSWLT